MTKFNKVAESRDSFSGQIKRLQEGKQTKKGKEEIKELKRKETDMKAEMEKLFKKVKRLETKLANV